MKIVMIAALAAAQLPAAAGAADLPREVPATQPSADGRSAPRAEERLQLSLADAQAPVGDAQPADAPADEPKKRKSTGDKVLTGAAVVLGIAAVAVAGLLIAIAVN